MFELDLRNGCKNSWLWKSIAWVDFSQGSNLMLWTSKSGRRGAWISTLYWSACWASFYWEQACLTWTFSSVFSPMSSEIHNEEMQWGSCLWWAFQIVSLKVRRSVQSFRGARPKVESAIFLRNWTGLDHAIEWNSKSTSYSINIQRTFSNHHSHIPSLAHFFQYDPNTMMGLVRRC